MISTAKLKSAAEIRKNWNLDSVPGFAIVLDSDSRLVACNSLFEEQSPFAMLDMLGGLWFRLFHYSLVSEFLLSLKEKCALKKSFQVRLRLQNKDLDFRWIQFEAIVREHAEESFYYLIGQDISASYDDSRMLDWSQRQAKIGSFMYDVRANKTNWSKEACRILSLPQTQI